AASLDPGLSSPPDGTTVGKIATVIAASNALAAQKGAAAANPVALFASESEVGRVAQGATSAALGNSADLDQTVSDFTGAALNHSVDEAADEVTACFCRGTLIRTTSGEVAVEDLQIGDEVVTVFGGVQAIKWIGHRAYAGRFVAGNPQV